MIKAAASLTCLLTAAASAQCEGWTPVPGCPNPYITGETYAAVAFDPDGPGPLPEQLVIGGSALQIPGLPRAHIYRWDGRRWSAMGDGVDASVYALAVWNGRLYAGGDFTASGAQTVSALARWTGNGWEPLGAFARASGVPTVRALCEFDGRLILAGAFSSIDALQAPNIAAWDGASFAPLGPGLNNYTRAAAVHEGALIVGGDFTAAGALPANHLARWDGAAWSALGPSPSDQGVNATVRALASFDDSLVLGGDFTVAGRAFAAPYLVALRSGGWERLGAPNAIVRGLLATPDRLLVAGVFSSIDGAPLQRLAAWTGSAWSDELGGLHRLDPYYSGASGIALAPWRDGFVVGGSFGLAGDLGSPCVAVHTPEGWSGFTQGLYGGKIRSLAMFRGDLYAGGDFRSFGPDLLQGLARWDGRRWAPVPGWSGPATIRALLVADDRLWIHGQLTAPGAGASLAAAFDGDRWLWADPTDNAPEILQRPAWWRGSLAVAGARSPMLWDGRAWTLLPAPPAWSAREQTIAAADDALFATSLFWEHPLWRFDGLLWTELPIDQFTSIQDMIEHRGALCLGGAYEGMTMSRWNGDAWTQWGCCTFLSELAPVGDRLFCDASDLFGDFPRDYVAQIRDDQGLIRLPRSPYFIDRGLPVGDFFDALLVASTSFPSNGGADGHALHVSGPPVIIGQPLPAPCSEPRLDAVAIGMNLRYQWRRDGLPIDGATSASLGLSRLGPAGLYDCLIANDCGEALSSPVLYAPCPADHTCDGFADFFDYDAFLADFQAGLPAADLNADGFLDLFDYADFVASFEAGC